WIVLSPRKASSATFALNASEKFRRFAILVSLQISGIHLRNLFGFPGALQISQYCGDATLSV
ncbi:MAG: hypothetical protein ABJ360_13370, partial [Roseobacter sp.]